MGLIFGTSQGELDGTTEVEVVEAGDDTRVVRQLYVFNADAVNVTLTLYRRVAGTNYEMDKRVDLAPGESWRVIDGDDVVWLVGDTQSLRVVMSAAVDTDPPIFTASFFDRS